MTAASRPFYSIPSEGAASEARARHRAFPVVRIWLFTVAAFVLVMVVVGGATRLTGSGLSITEWQPILGIVPPLSHSEWMEAFGKYQEIPQYQAVNRGMALSEFQSIYWWEWAHRFIGRLVGFVFLVPFALFLWRGSIPRRWIGPVALLFVLGASQGALGWFMVKSGLSGRVDVSQYRLAAHLALAAAIGGYAVWLGLSFRAAPASLGDRGRSGASLIDGALLLSGAIYLQLIMGAFVAGLKAGHAASTWPTMGDSFVPEGLWTLSPWYSNPFENPLAAQFVHRMLGYGVAALALAIAVKTWRTPGRWLTVTETRMPILRRFDRIETCTRTRRARIAITVVVAAIAVQIGLGIATVVYDVPLTFALAHQANGMILFGLSLWYAHVVVHASRRTGLRGRKRLI